MKGCIVIASSIILGGCNPLGMDQEQVTVATDNLALQGLERSCSDATDGLTAARERIQELAALERDVSEIVLLQQYAGEVEDLCQPDAPTTNSFRVDQLAKQIDIIDGLPDEED